MRAHDGHDGIRELDAIQYLRAHDRVNLHLLELFSCEAPRLRENVLGNSELTDVVQHGGRANGIQLSFVQPEFLGNLDRINLYPAQVIVCGVILRFNRKGKRLDGAQVKRSNFLGVFLLRLEAAQVGPVGAIDPINDGEREKTKLPADQPIDGAYSTSNQRAKQVIGEGPQIAFLPDVDRVAIFRHGNDARDRNGIEGEIGRRCRGHQKRPAKSDARGDFAMKDQLCGADGEREVCQIKEPLDRAGTRIGLPERLEKSPETAHQNGFGIREVKNSDENEQEIRRHRGLDARQLHFEYGGT